MFRLQLLFPQHFEDLALLSSSILDTIRNLLFNYYYFTDIEILTSLRPCDYFLQPVKLLKKTPITGADRVIYYIYLMKLDNSS